MGESFSDAGLVHVGAGHLSATIFVDFGKSRYADAADTDEMYICHWAKV